METSRIAVSVAGPAARPLAATKHDVGSCRAGACPGLGRPKGWPYTHDEKCLPKKQEITILQYRAQPATAFSLQTVASDFTDTALLTS